MSGTLEISRRLLGGVWRTGARTEGALNGNGGSQPGWLGDGDGPPVGILTPDPVFIYVDTTNGAVYVAIGPTDTDWVIFGADPNGIGAAAGFAVNASDRSVGVLAGDPDEPLDGVARLSDAYSQWNGNGDGLRWTGNGTDGEQELQIQTGLGAHQGKLQDKDGNMTVPGSVTSSQPQGKYESGGTEEIANDTSGDLPFALDSGDALLDLTDPDSPTFVVAGLYVLTVTVQVTEAFTAGGYAHVSVEAQGEAPIVTALDRTTGATVSGAVKVAADAALIVRVTNQDGVAARTFTLASASVVKIA